MTSHHAVLLSTELPLQHYPETITPHQEYRQPQFGIDMVRTLISAAHLRPEHGQTEQVILVATEFITEEAQQALLKIIEEPPVSTKFVFVLPQGYSLLPTLESRFSRVTDEMVVTETATFTDFLNATIKERFELIEQSIKQKDHSWQSDIKRGLTGYLKQSRQKLSAHEIKELEFVVRLLLTRGASNKFLLEHLALSLPA